MRTARFCAPDGSELRVTLTDKERILGRPGGDVDVALEGDRALSRRHARLWEQDGKIWYEDLGSFNGSFIGGSRLSEPVELTGDVKIRLGNTILTLQDGPPSAPPKEQATVPATVRMALPATGSLPDQAVGGRHLQALLEFTRGLLRSTSQELVEQAIRRLNELIPGARRIALLDWPAAATSGVNLELAQFAIDNDQALLTDGAVYAPLMDSERQVLGVLWVDAPGTQIAETEFQLFRAVGELLAAALSAERLREQARIKELEAREQRARKTSMLNFLKIASHDLKNPLTVVQFCAQLLDVQADRPERVTALAEDLMDAARRAFSLIDVYLQVAQVETEDQLHLEWQPIPIRELIEAEIAFLKRAHSTRGLDFEVKVATDEVWADRGKLRQILANLISNAVKYSPNGGRISIEVEPAAELVRFRVTDQGIGISAEDQTRLFRQFERLGNVGLVPGTGLGLWLTQALVEAHGGRLGVISVPGVGSTFSFTIPV